MIDIMDKTDNESFGPLDELDYTLSASGSADVESLKNLHRLRWIAPTLPATIGDFAFHDDNTVRGVYITQVPWRLAHALGDDAPLARQDTADNLRRILLEKPKALMEIVQDLEAAMAVEYLDQLLIRKYGEEPVPEHRLPEAHNTFRTALQGGFTLGQLIAVAWSSTASSVAWGQRTPGLKPGSVSSASVTNLERRMGFARDRAIPEYDLPNWVARPATYPTALRLLEQHNTEWEALLEFRTLQQRIASHHPESVELDLDLAEPADPDQGKTLAQLLEEHVDHKRAANERHETPITYALVNPDGSLEFRTESPIEMRDRVSLAGNGFVDRITMQEPPTLNAYIGELVPRSADMANPVADEMLWLLGNEDGPLPGPVSFFGVAPGRPSPSSLDEDHQKLLRAAHQVAQARKKANR
ncbi:hypothetical protein [Saccharopolyspora rectivirgula]|uniref:hypothetical protein n=1 Tax=Saccharopolyspora rectivirgula TaxID=28042 RepID=UPI0024096E7C|nr:hypothetical protein [Saccharopolyspora rectivirgula]